MCCFSGSVSFVSNTNIFVRPSNGSQILVYEMRYGASSDLAMILPLPVPPLITTERAVRFVNLEEYPEFFEDMDDGFPKTLTFGRVGASRSMTLEAPAQPLIVHDVGSFEASFVPHMDDFDRLDERFRISRDVWAKAPEYADYGFAVFKLKPARDSQIHPIALEFPRRDKERLFVPTVHVHDGEIHDEANFDHTIYCQVPASMEAQVAGWEVSEQAPTAFMLMDLAQDLVWPLAPLRRDTLRGMLPNFDTWIGEEGQWPGARWGIRARCLDCGHERGISADMRAGMPCQYCGGHVEERRVGPPPRRG